MTRLDRFLRLAVLLLLVGCDSPGSDTSVPADSMGEGPSHSDEAAASVHDDQEGMALLPIMRQLAVEMAALQNALWLEDHAEVEERAHAIAEHAHVAPEELARIRSVLGEEMAEFERLDEAVHRAAVAMHEASRARQTGALLDRLAEVQRGCVECHERFRERLRTER